MPWLDVRLAVVGAFGEPHLTIRNGKWNWPRLEMILKGFFVHFA